MTLTLIVNETLKFSSLPILMQESLKHKSGGDSVAIGINQSPSSPTSWDLGPCQYLFGDKSALNRFNQPTCLVQRTKIVKGFAASHFCEEKLMQH